MQKQLTQLVGIVDDAGLNNRHTKFAGLPTNLIQMCPAWFAMQTHYLEIFKLYELNFVIVYVVV